MTSGIEFYDKIAYIEEHFEEEKDVLVQKLQMLAHKLFRADNMMISYTVQKKKKWKRMPKIKDSAMFIWMAI